MLDTGGVDGLAPIDAKRRARLRALLEHADDLELLASLATNATRLSVLAP